MSPDAESRGPLSGCQVLVVEDEYFLADDIFRALTALGARVIGPYGDLNEAAHVMDGDIAIDAAVVDINLRTQMVFPLARVLRSRNVPLIFTTGYDPSSIEPEFQNVRVWSKPLDIRAMTLELSGMIKSN